MTVGRVLGEAFFLRGAPGFGGPGALVTEPVPLLQETSGWSSST